MFAIFQSLEVGWVVILEIELAVGFYQFYLVRKLKQTTKQDLFTLSAKVRKIETTVPSVLREAASNFEKQIAASRPGSSGADPE